MTEHPTDDGRPDEAAGGAADVPFDDWFGDDADADEDVDDVDGRGFDGDPRVHDGVEHLQRAAREMVAASRAFLDVVEELVERPEAVQELLGAVGSLGELAGRAIRTGGRPAGPRSRTDAGTGDVDGVDDDPDDPPAVQRIPVS